MAQRILNVVTNVAHYDEPDHPTGLWLSELTHAWHVFEDAGFEQTLVSPAGGAVPLEPRSLKFPNYDKTAKAWRADPAKMALLEHTLSPEQIDSADYDAIYFTGGHAVMYDFPDSDGLQRITREIYEGGGIVSSVCQDDRLRLDRGGARPGRQTSSLQRRGEGQGARGALREGQAPLRFLHRRRRQSRHRPEPGLGEGDREEGRGCTALNALGADLCRCGRLRG